MLILPILALCVLKYVIKKVLLYNIVLFKIMIIVFTLSNHVVLYKAIFSYLSCGALNRNVIIAQTLHSKFMAFQKYQSPVFKSQVCKLEEVKCPPFFLCELIGARERFHTFLLLEIS
jgi:hypothetical protein